MPVMPGTFATSVPVTAHQLNEELYTYDGSYFGANGVMFHSNRPLLAETFTGVLAVGAAPGGTFTAVGGVGQDAISVIDNAALFGSGADYPGDQASFTSVGAVAPGSSGIPGYAGGWNLVTGFVPLGKFSTTASCYGTSWAAGGTALLDIGTMQPGSATWHNCGFAMDLVERQAGVVTPWQPVVFAQDSAGVKNTVQSNTVSTVGETPRFTEVWVGVQNGYGATVATVPSPASMITGVTPVTSGLLNTTIRDVFNLMNYPPMLNVQVASYGQAVGAGSVATVEFTQTPQVDSYSGYTVSTWTYTVQLPGWYLCHANITFSSTSGEFTAGFDVNGTVYWGGTYNAITSGAIPTGVAVTKVLDLEAGDTVSVVVEPTTNATVGGSSYESRWIMTWLSPLSGGMLRNPPDVTGFQLAAGTAPESVTTLNTVNPYFTQGTSGWTVAGSGAGFTVTSSPAAGIPYPYAGVLTAGTASAGLLNSGDTFRVSPLSTYVASAWVYSTLSLVQLGFSWLDGSGGGISNSIQTFTVPVNAWTQVQVSPSAAPLGAASGYVRLSTIAGSGGTVQTTGVLAAERLQPLGPVLNQRIVNDVNFVFNRPMLSVHQTVPQTSPVNSTVAVSMTATTGLVHGTGGDNYGGWSAPSYTAQVPGWYLAFSEVAFATSATSGSGYSVTAGFSVPVSGGLSSPVSPQGQPDWYQQLMIPDAGTRPAGATAVGCYYLLGGETITPVARWESSTAVTSFTTDTSHGFLSHFSLFWVSN